MAATSDLPGGVPGFDFLQGLFQNPGAGLPAMGAWIAPTLKPEELDKRIQELKTVQFWLEQNAKLLAATIQALEVQRMTLVTLQTLNLPLADLSEALKIKPPAPPAPAAPADAAVSAGAVTTPAAAAAPAPVVDPMQWWGALTRQFGELAVQAVREVPAAAEGQAPGKAGAKRATRPAVKRSSRSAQSAK